LQQLALLKGFEFDELDPTGSNFIHLQVEAAKLAFADRDTFYGDPNFVETPVDILLSDAYNTKRRADQRSSLLRAAAGVYFRIRKSA
jgi:gamma-glutamyltranspeptidase/glutathione hydrolase